MRKTTVSDETENLLEKRVSRQRVRAQCLGLIAALEYQVAELNRGSMTTSEHRLLHV